MPQEALPVPPSEPKTAASQTWNAIAGPPSVRDAPRYPLPV